MTDIRNITDELVRSFGRTRAQITIAIIAAKHSTHVGVDQELAELNRRLRQLDTAWAAFQATH